MSATYYEWLRSLSNEDVEWQIKEHGDLDKAFIAYLEEQRQ